MDRRDIVLLLYALYGVIYQAKLSTGAYVSDDASVGHEQRTRGHGGSIAINGDRIIGDLKGRNTMEAARMKRVPSGVSPVACMHGTKDVRSDAGTINLPFIIDMHSSPQRAYCSWSITAGKNRGVELTPGLFEVFCADGVKLTIYDGVNMDAPVLGAYCGPYFPPGVTVSSGSMLIVIELSFGQAGYHFEATYRQVESVQPPSIFNRTYNEDCERADTAQLMTPVTSLTESVPHGWPWQVLIASKHRPSGSCSGVIISSQWVLTVSSCARTRFDLGPASLKVIAGKHDLAVNETEESIHAVSMIVEHGRRESLALIKVETPFNFNDHIAPLCLPENDATYLTTCVTTGWFSDPTQDTVLQQSLVSVEAGDCPGVCAAFEDSRTCSLNYGAPLACLVDGGNSYRLRGAAVFGDHELCEESGVRPYALLSDSRLWIESQVGGCFGTVHLSDEEGYISSHGYPYSYPNGFICEWLIEGAEDKNVRLDVRMLSLEDSPGCQNDVLRIRDGPSERDPILAELCGYILPEEVVTTGQQARIQFSTDSAIAAAGFKLYYHLVPADAKPTGDCTDITELTGDHGRLGSPGFPFVPYPPNIDCVWRIVAAPGKLLRTTIETLAVEPSPSCTADHLDVYDGDLSTQNLLGTYCGLQTVPVDHTSSNNTLTFHFVSDDSIEDAGFDISWSTEDQPETEPETHCPDTVVDMDSESGNFSSPGFEEGLMYPSQATCSWRITAPPSKVVVLRFLNFTLENPDGAWMEICKFDAVSVYDGPTAEAALLGFFCGSDIPHEISSTTNSMFIVLNTDAFTQREGFKAQYSQREAPHGYYDTLMGQTVACGRQSEEPNFERIVGGRETVPNSWPWQVSLRWRGYNNFTHFCGGSIIAPNWVVTAAHCVKDGEYFYGSPSDLKVIIGDHNRMTKDLSEQTIDVAAIMAHSLYNRSTIDFDIALLRLKSPVTYKREVWPVCLAAEDYQTGKMCVASGWGDSRGTSDETVLQQVVLPMVSYEYCNGSDSYNGMLTDNMICAGYEEGVKSPCHGDSGGPLVCRQNGRYNLQGIVSWGQACAAVAFPGVFSRVPAFLGWIEEKSGVTPDSNQPVCPRGIVDMPEGQGVFSTPGYEDNLEYLDNDECAWRIRVAENERVHLHFEEFSLTDYSMFCNDQVQIYDGPDFDSAVIHVFCGTQLPPAITATGNVIVVVFRSDSFTRNRGFLAHYSSTNVTLEETSISDINATSQDACGVPEVEPMFQRIIGGVEAVPNSWPWQVSLRNLQVMNGSHLCGGSIIAPHWILTAAHCISGAGRFFFSDPREMRVVVGDHDRTEIDPTEQYYEVAHYHLHRGYVSYADFDIALLRLRRPITYRREVTPVCLAETDFPAGAPCVATGWGVANFTPAYEGAILLQQVLVPRVDKDVCSTSEFYNLTLTENMVCAGYMEGGKGGCHGDSGGPLVCRRGGVYFQQGLTSWGGLPCASPNHPTVYTDIPMLLDWIYGQMESD